MTRIGSLFSGYGGLDMAVQEVLGGEVVWYSEIDKAACQVLAAHHPGVPNLGDITTVDWAAVPPVDILTGGYPCQPFSHAGQRKGTNDERHLWPHVRDAIAALRPMVAVFENVDGHRSLGLADVLGDLADLGLSVRWGVVRAADAGAPHGRKRVFIVCGQLPHAGSGHWGARTGRFDPQEEPQAAAGLEQPTSRPVTADADLRRREQRHAGVGRVSVIDEDRSCNPAADADGDGHGGQLHAAGMAGVEGEAAGGAPERQRPRREPDARGDVVAADAERPGAGIRGATSGRGRQASRTSGAALLRPENGSASADRTASGSAVAWGKYGPAIARWERITRPAPAPTVPGVNGRPRLSPYFVEWMMGLPEGHVTGHGLRPAACLKMLGNGVVPQQAALALRMLLDGAA